ncbi:hypothetical protein [Actinomadura macrotermitis]|uniref:Uncharacterized protein n=1 Tax=Actinomadura macrotermitis TaxID=2585200 RepID=A0A7K0C4N3_9ACTN|nr:hypothetical protein [Actinomadura macrotermitis]MQY08403.1 hypothetical protein [Actinomadura macrotermitis]
MVKSVLSIGERLLTTVLPGADASACCPPDCWTEAHCAGSCVVSCRYCYNCRCEAVNRGCSYDCGRSVPC